PTHSGPVHARTVDVRPVDTGAIDVRPGHAGPGRIRSTLARTRTHTAGRTGTGATGLTRTNLRAGLTGHRRLARTLTGRLTSPPLTMPRSTRIERRARHVAPARHRQCVAIGHGRRRGARARSRPRRGRRWAE